METLTNTNIPDETKAFIKTCIEKEEFCDVTLAFKDGHRSCNTFVFLLVGQFWKDIIKSLQGEWFSCIIVPDLGVQSFDLMIQLLLDGFATILNGEKEAVKEDLRTFFPNIPTKSIFNVDDKSMICKYCLEEFSRKEAKLLHEKRCIGPKRFSYNECSKRFKTFQAKIIHEKTHKDKNFHYVCPKCGKCFKYHQNMLRHIKSKKHDYPEEDVYPHAKNITKDAVVVCDICHRGVKRLAHHKRTHHSKNSRSFSCNMCEFKTDRSDTLAEHQYVKHKMTNRKFSKLDETFKDGKPNYECFDCKRIFHTFIEIEKHMLLKNCEELVCRICGKKFKQKKNLNQHMKEVHENPNTFKCEKCGKVYSHKRSLDKHTKICK